MQKNKDLIHYLNLELSNVAVLYVKLHRYHWYIKGSQFFTLHAIFEEHYKELANDFDQIAERILAIGGRPFAIMEKYLETTSLKEAQADDEGSEMIRQLIEDYQQISDEIQQKALPQARDYRDKPTEDLLIGFQTKLEKYIWMLKAHQKL
ncbi:Dps family protein [Paraliobacillus sediminis]|uniref:Dps family protein n=1 Tax=Paraliobacillus sediminis TaxID=1885916 RepID=UPI000E3C46B5|nr:DNA starvation/stationary phase protection protein [Paraliobacillus sediminis]